MTTLEVVEAVQRSLENEGFLQLIRAQLRSNVLRIISSGPEYSPQTGKSVELTHRQHGVIALQLVRQLLEQYNLRESLAVLEAEAGLNEETFLDRRYLQDKLDIHTGDNESVLESLVESVLQLREKRNNADDLRQSSKDQTIVVDSVLANEPTGSKDDDLASVPEEESVVEEEDDVDYSQIEDRDTVESRDQSHTSSAVNSPVKAVAASKDESDSPLQLDAKHLSPRTSPGAKASPTPPAALHPSFHSQGSKQLDVSSSFEADSPARSQASHVAPQKLNAMVLEDSFAEEPEEELSVEEEIEEEVEDEEKEEDSMAKEEEEKQEEEVSKAVSPIKSPERDAKRNDSRSFSAGEEEEEEQGPEYDSDHSSHSAAEAKENAQEREQIGHKGDSSKHTDSDSSVHSAGAEAEHVTSSLRPAVADDFDPTDRSAADHSLSSSSTNRNRVAVRRAAMEAAESKNSADSNVPGAKASVFRLGQSSISRSQLGWGSETSAHAVDADHSESEEVDDGDFAVTEKGVRNSGRSAAATARYTSTSQMEAVSFDTDEDDGERPSPVRAEPRRSNNQESESEGENDRKDKDRDNNSSRESAHSADDFEAEEDSEGDVSFGDDEDVLPSVGKGVPARAAFGSPPTKSTSHSARHNEEEEDEGDEADEYGDDDFVEDEEEEEEYEPQQKPVSRQAPVSNVGLFNTRAGAVPNKAPQTSYKYEEEEEEEGSVEEEIEEEVEEDMSVGDMDSDEDDDGGFGSPVQAKKKGNQQQQQQQQKQSSRDGLFRAGRSGPLPGVSSVAAAAKGKSSHFDSILNSDDSSDSEGEANRKNSAGAGKRGAVSGPGSSSSITDRMREIDSQLEELEQDDPHLAKLKNRSDDENSVASEDIDAMEFSTGGGQDNDSESSGEGSFSFLDASTKK